VSDEESGRGPRELVAVIALAVTAVLTAWSGFEASKWSGEMSIAFSRASTARIEASRYAAQADAARGFDLNVFGVYVQAVAEDDDRLREFVETRFTDHFAVAFDAWIAMRPLENPDAPKGPFALPEYQPPGEAEAAEADARADGLFAQALRNNQRGDNYTLLTVLFALVLFFTAVSQRIRSTALSHTVLAGAMVLLVVGIGLLIAFPKII
jgi:hypothetical protein